MIKANEAFDKTIEARKKYDKKFEKYDEKIKAYIQERTDGTFYYGEMLGRISLFDLSQIEENSQNIEPRMGIPKDYRGNFPIGPVANLFFQYIIKILEKNNYKIIEIRKQKTDITEIIFTWEYQPYYDCCCFKCKNLTEEASFECGCKNDPMYIKDWCMECPKRRYCKVTAQPWGYIPKKTKA